MKNKFPCMKEAEKSLACKTEVNNGLDFWN